MNRLFYIPALLLFTASTLYAQTNVRRTTLPGRRTPSHNQQQQQSTLSSTEIAKKIAAAETNANNLPKLNFDNAPAEIFLQIYAKATNRTLLTSPDVPKVNMSIKSNNEDRWTKDEYLQAIETQLQLNGISVIPAGEQFLIVVPFKSIGQNGIETFIEMPESGKHPEIGKIIRQIITPKDISAEEAQKAIESFKRPDGQIQFLERTNSLLITDTQENVNRMLEIINFIDKPLPVMEEVQVRSIKFAKAEDIKKALEEFVEASQKQEESTKKSVAAPRLGNSLSGGMQQGSSITRSRLPGVIRANHQPEPQVSTVQDALVNDADRGMIRGKVQIMADSRSNQLIIVTRPANMQFFDRIITVLDIETAPEVAVEVIRLKYAQAETKDSVKGVSELLNELIDASSSKKDENSVKTGTATGRNANLTNTDQPRTLSPAAQAVSQNMNSSVKSKIGQLSKDNIKILPDPRINAIMVMASPADLAAVKEIIASMDIQVAQVLIETVVMNVTLESGFSTGIDWIKRVGNGSSYRDIATGGNATLNPINMFEAIVDGSTNAVNTVAAMKGGLAYYATLDKLNLDFVIEASANDGRSKILTSPIIMTQDNKEATIESTQLVYLYNGLKYTGSVDGSSTSGYTADVKQQEVGLTVKVTPRINPDGTVVLSVEETYQDVNGKQEIGGEQWDKIFTRKITADISVDNGKTIVIGGLVKTSTSNSESGIPFLKDLPFIGKYLFGKTEKSESRDELLVFMTPYVFNSATDAQKEAARRKDYLNAAGVWNKGWSKSDIADEVNEVEKLKRDSLMRAYTTEQEQAKIKREKADRKYDEKHAENLRKSIRIRQEELDSKTLTPAQQMKVAEELLNEKRMLELIEGAALNTAAESSTDSAVAPEAMLETVK